MAARTASSWTSRRAVTSGLSSLGIPTQITVRPSAARRSITSPARRVYSGSHSSLAATGSPLRNEPSATARPWASLPPNVTTTMSGSAVGSSAVRCAGQSKKSGRASPDDTL